MDKILIHCSQCNKALSIPANKHIKFNCPTCGKAHEYKNGTLIINSTSQTKTINKEPEYSSFIDNRDGKEYKTVKIGKQLWMAENLNFVGDNGFHREIKNDNEWTNSDCYGWCYYDNKPGYGNIYGVLYQWEAAKWACPEGWHLPTDEEWDKLINFLGGKKVAGGKMKAKDTKYWKEPNQGATNQSGFSALSSGPRDDDGSFHYLGYYGWWWSATESSSNDAYGRTLNNEDAKVRRNPYDKPFGFSVRCVRD